MRFWSGTHIRKLQSSCIFVFGSNPEGRHGDGAAKKALQFGAVRGIGRGLQGHSYALITKNISQGFIELETGIRYDFVGKRSLSKGEIVDNIEEMYSLASKMLGHMFVIPYQSKDENLNGYSPREMFEMFTSVDVPPNIFFHNSMRQFL